LEAVEVPAPPEIAWVKVTSWPLRTEILNDPDLSCSKAESLILERAGLPLSPATDIVKSEDAVRSTTAPDNSFQCLQVISHKPSDKIEHA
jgi:hypothetical protein